MQEVIIIQSDDIENLFLTFLNLKIAWEHTWRSKGVNEKVHNSELEFISSKLKENEEVISSFLKKYNKEAFNKFEQVLEAYSEQNKAL